LIEGGGETLPLRVTRGDSVGGGSIIFLVIAATRNRLSCRQLRVWRCLLLLKRNHHRAIAALGDSHDFRHGSTTPVQSTTHQSTTRNETQPQEHLRAKNYCTKCARIYTWPCSDHKDDESLCFYTGTAWYLVLRYGYLVIYGWVEEPYTKIYVQLPRCCLRLSEASVIFFGKAPHVALAPLLLAGLSS